MSVNMDLLKEFIKKLEKRDEDLVEQSRRERDIEYAKREELIGKARMLTTEKELLDLIARFEILHYEIKETDRKIRNEEVSASFADDPYTQKEACDLEKEIREKLHLK